VELVFLVSEIHHNGLILYIGTYLSPKLKKFKKSLLNLSVLVPLVDRKTLFDAYFNLKVLSSFVNRVMS
jgi:hypothetical protein